VTLMVALRKSSKSWSPPLRAAASSRRCHHGCRFHFSPASLRLRSLLPPGNVPLLFLRRPTGAALARSIVEHDDEPLDFKHATCEAVPMVIHLFHLEAAVFLRRVWRALASCGERVRNYRGGRHEESEEAGLIRSSTGMTLPLMPGMNVVTQTLSD
jgi:hypothetical protein